MTATSTAPKGTIVDAARDQVPTGRIVDIVARVGGTIPLEWPRGEKGLTKCDYSSSNRMINIVVKRDVELGYEQRESLNLDNPDDAEFLERVKDWIANSRDPRIDRFGVQVIEGGVRESLPFPRYAEMKANVVIAMLENFLGDDEEANRLLLEKCARYELQIPDEAPYKGPRQKVLDALETMGTLVGYESGDDEVVEA